LQALYSNGGYTYLDVRSQLEVEEVGKVKDAVNVPFMLASRKYDPETREKKIVKEPNTEFIRQVRAALEQQQSDNSSSNQAACLQECQQLLFAAQGGLYQVFGHCRSVLQLPQHIALPLHSPLIDHCSCHAGRNMHSDLRSGYWI
jgi:hypothetical protein